MYAYKDIYSGTSLSLFNLMNLERPSLSHPYPNTLISALKANIMTSILISHVL